MHIGDMQYRGAMEEYQKIVFEEISRILKIVVDIEQNPSREALEKEFLPCLKVLGVAKWIRKWFTPPRRLSTGDETIVDEYTVLEKPFDEQKKEVFRFDVPQKGYYECTFILADEVEVTDELKWCCEYVAQNIFMIMSKSFLDNAYGYLNTHDELTGAHNRRYLETTVANYSIEGKLDQYIAARINLKNFKHINDRFGSKVGNEFLKRFVTAMMLMLNKDEVFTRLGGDNFVLFVHNSREEFYKNQLLHLEFEMNTHEGVKRFRVHMRAGIYRLQVEDRFGDMMDCTGEALRHARLPEYEDFVWYEEKMSAQRVDERQILEDYPKALSNREFVAFYQPKVLLENSTLCGAEALCRWKKNGQIIPPNMFIPVLEKEGAVGKLDFYMLEQVCMDIAQWSAHRLDPGRISVNFSKTHLRDEKFADKIIEIIDKYDVDHKYIEIELTETTDFDNMAMREFVSYMKSMDITTSVDDFGTGYSSLNMISGVRTDIIKLDKSFIDNIEEKPSIDQSFVKNIVNMINELSMETVAEGIESVAQAKLLRKWECRVGQGYLYDKPMSMEAFTERLKSPVYDIDLE